jgi:dTDP-4-amino-4,6-dideoxygalactose transaminase
MYERGISCNVHYKPLPMLTAYRNLGYSINECPNAYSLYSQEISLPLHTLLSDEQAIYIAGSLNSIVRELGL